MFGSRKNSNVSGEESRQVSRSASRVLEPELREVNIGKHIPRLIAKLSDSKNIIRQQAIRALIGTFLIMKEGKDAGATIDADNKSDKSGVSASNYSAGIDTTKDASELKR